MINIIIIMSLLKEFDTNKGMCKVTFTVTKDKTNFAGQVNLVGDFNNWDIGSIPMKKHPNGDFSASIELKQGREYEFKYLVNGNEWINESDADQYVLNKFRTNNSVVDV